MRKRLKLIALGLVGMLVISCDSPQKKARNLIEEKGVEPTADTLRRAVWNGEDELAKALVTYGVNVDEVDEGGRSALILAAMRGSPEMVGFLAEKSKAPILKDQQKMSALAYAVERGELESVVRLLERGSFPRGVDSSGESMVLGALREGRLAITKSLLDAGADPKSKGADGVTLASLATRQGQRWLLDDLVARGVDLKQVNGHGETLLHESLKEDQEELLDYLIGHGVDLKQRSSSGDSVVHAVVARGQSEMLRPLARAGADMDAVNAEGSRPVHLALLTRDNELLKEVLSTGGRTDLKSVQGQRSTFPLRLAVENRNYEAVRLLLRYGAPKNDEVYLAVAMGGRDGLDYLTMLLHEGASPNPMRVPYSDTPLMLAVRMGDVRMARLLLKEGARVEDHGWEGQGPLHLAIAYGNESLVNLLLKHGADPNVPFAKPIRDDFLDQITTKGVGKWALQRTHRVTPLMLAADTGNVEVAQALIDYGAYKNITTRKGGVKMWPLTFATRRSDVKMMQVILGSSKTKRDRWIKVDLSQQRAWVYDGPEKVVFSTRISSGKKGYRTKTGEFVITNKYPMWTSTLYDSKMPYFQRLSAGDFGFHTGALPGYPASHGCIRLPNSSARKLYSLTRVGDFVKIVP